MSVYKNYIISDFILRLPFDINFIETTQLPHNVNFEISNISDQIENKSSSLKWSKSSLDLGFYYDDDVGLFKINQGNNIQLDLKKKCSDIKILNSLLFSPLAILMLQRNKLVLHGSSLNFNDENIIVCGQSGSGKSSLTSELLKRGLKMLSEDIIPYCHKTNMIWPTFPLIKINSAQAHRNLQYSKLYEIDNDQRKRSLYCIKEDSFCKEASMAKRIFFLDNTQANSVKKIIDKAEIFSLVMGNIWRGVPHNSCNVTDNEILDRVGALIRNNSFYRLGLGKNFDYKVEKLLINMEAEAGIEPA